MSYAASTTMGGLVGSCYNPTESQPGARLNPVRFGSFSIEQGWFCLPGSRDASGCPPRFRTKRRQSRSADGKAALRCSLG